MALVQATLANQLENLTPTGVEATAINALATAWDTYFQGASVTGVPITAGVTATAKTAMMGALAGMSVPNAGAAKIQAGITAYWATLVPLFATLWVIPPNVVTALTPPPTLAGIAAALTSVFASNTSSQATLAQAAANVAAALHTSGGLGAIAVVQPPLPAAPVPTPVL